MELDWKWIVYLLVLAAEQYIKGTKKGAERKEWVLDQIYSHLPSIVSTLLPRETAEDLIEQGVTMMKEHLAEQVDE